LIAAIVQGSGALRTRKGLRLMTVRTSFLLATALICMLTLLPLRAEAATPPLQAGTVNPAVHRFHEVYYTLQHNTFDYGSSLTGWLDQGFRSVELDIIDKENWELDANGPYVSHDTSSGNKNCSGNPDRLGHCLNDIKAWLSSRPNEGPILVFIDMKASWDPANAWHNDEVYLLDEKVKSILGSTMYTGNDLYQYAAGTAYTGSGTSLRQAVSNNGWPVLNTLKGKIIVAYTGGKIGLANQTQGNGIDYILGQTPKRLPYGFFCPDVESDPNELNPGGTVDGISNSTSQTIVCANIAAQDHYQITANRSAQHKQLLHIWGDHVYNTDSYMYNYLSVAHGVSAIGRNSNPTDTFGNAIPYVGVRRSLPGYFELRPLNGSNKCMDVNGSGTSNGTKIQVWDCNGSNAQQFVFTAEGQLRPKHANTFCSDISGGSAGNDKKVHLWDCDGGSSEKWVITTDGSFKSYNNQSYCLDAANGSSSNGAQYLTKNCSSSNNQRFELRPVSDWLQTSF
jgi:hypothetical protein